MRAEGANICWETWGRFHETRWALACQQVLLPCPPRQCQRPGGNLPTPVRTLLLPRVMMVARGGPPQDSAITKHAQTTCFVGDAGGSPAHPPKNATTAK
eukprot:6068749-Alexandrium_andersonii.AAC.1